MDNKREIYLDNAATTRAFDEVGERVRDCLCCCYGNPSSLHGKGLEAEHVLRESSEQIAGLLKVPRDTIIFTSGGTESDNLAIFKSQSVIICQFPHRPYIDHLSVLPLFDGISIS